jgi:hypothetical protein
VRDVQAAGGDGHGKVEEGSLEGMSGEEVEHAVTVGREKSVGHATAAVLAGGLGVALLSS